MLPVELDDVESPEVASLGTRAVIEAAIRWGFGLGPEFINIEDLETTEVPAYCVNVTKLHGLEQLRVEVIPYAPGPPTDEPL